MAKFRQGDLVLTSTQEIIQGIATILGANGAASFATLGVSGASNLGVLDAGVTTLTTLNAGATTVASLGVSGSSIIESANITTLIVDSTADIAALSLESLTFASGATVGMVDADANLAADSDVRISTQKAIKTYVDALIGGTVPPGTDQAIVRYNGLNSVEDSGVFIDDSDNVTGINNLDIGGDLTIQSSEPYQYLVETGAGGTSQAIMRLNNGYMWIENQSELGESEILFRGYQDGVGMVWMITADPNDRVNLYYAGVKTISTRLDGMAILEGTTEGRVVIEGDDIAIKSEIADGAVNLYYDGTKTVETNEWGLAAIHATDPTLTLNDGSTDVAYIWHDTGSGDEINIDNNVDDGKIYLRGLDSGSARTYMLAADPNGSVDIYYDGAIVAQSTANGITGAVWG